MNDLVKEPAFAWWAPPVLKCRKCILSVVNKRYHKRMHKFGVKLPKTLKRALEIDQETGTTYSHDALKLEMKNVEVAFDIKDDDYHIPPAFQCIVCNLIFDIKMGSLKRKVCLVAGGHMKDPPAAITYASVVSCESV